MHGSTLSCDYTESKMAMGQAKKPQHVMTLQSGFGSGGTFVSNVCVCVARAGVIPQISSDRGPGTFVLQRLIGVAFDAQRRHNW